MNKDRRKLIASAHALVDEAKALLEQARDEEQEYFDNMPDSLQEGQRGQQADEVVETLQEMIDDLENIDFDQFHEGRA